MSADNLSSLNTVLLKAITDVTREKIPVRKRQHNYPDIKAVRAVNTKYAGCGDSTATG